MKLTYEHNGFEIFEKAAAVLGYERVEWDAENDCISGYGSADPYDRSRDDAGGLYICDTVEFLTKLIEG